MLTVHRSPVTENRLGPWDRPLLGSSGGYDLPPNHRPGPTGRQGKAWLPRLQGLCPEMPGAPEPPSAGLTTNPCEPLAWLLMPFRPSSPASPGNTSPVNQQTGTLILPVENPTQGGAESGIRSEETGEEQKMRFGGKQLRPDSARGRVTPGPLLV